MHVALCEPDALTRLVRIFRNDGSEVEVEMTAALAASIRRMDWAERRRERKHRKHVKNATDVKERPERWTETQRLVLPKPPNPGVIHLGESAIWAGPAAQWVTREGRVCRPGEEPVLNAAGRVVKRRQGQTCRWCGHLHRLPPNAVCYNGDCLRDRRETELSDDD